MTGHVCHEHNLRQPPAERRPFGIRVRMRSDDTFRGLLGDDWEKEHWFATRADRDAAFVEMSSRYVYFRPGDASPLIYEKIDP